MIELARVRGSTFTGRPGAGMSLSKHLGPAAGEASGQLAEVLNASYTGISSASTRLPPYEGTH